MKDRQLNDTVLKSRLQFIDVARSLAIILMLQGHFISHTYKDYSEMSSLVFSNGSSGNFAFDAWWYLRGFTAPLFFTISGLIFTFLLTRNQSDSFWQQKRVRKGIKRGISIILWGYFLQLSVRNISYYMSGRINDRFFAFHVLHCIGLGILSLILIYGISRYFRKLNLFYVLLFLGLCMIVATPFVETLGEHHFPSSAPQIIQNIFHGPHSIFPIFPWFGYIFIGGAIGVKVNEHTSKIHSKSYPIRFALIGVGSCLLACAIVFLFEQRITTDLDFPRIYARFFHLSLVITLLALLMRIERWGKIRIPFFLEMGKNTLNIYIIHVILLYGAVIGIGIRTYYQHSLSLTASIIGAILFILFFGLLTYVQPIIKSQIRRIFHSLIPAKKA